MHGEEKGEGGRSGCSPGPAGVHKWARGRLAEVRFVSEVDIARGGRRRPARRWRGFRLLPVVVDDDPDGREAPGRAEEGWEQRSPRWAPVGGDRGARRRGDLVGSEREEDRGKWASGEGSRGIGAAHIPSPAMWQLIMCKTEPKTKNRTKKTKPNQKIGFFRFQVQFQFPNLETI